MKKKLNKKQRNLLLSLDDIQVKGKNDIESIHGEMDDLLVRELKGLGYDLTPYEQQVKWYA